MINKDKAERKQIDIRTLHGCWQWGIVLAVISGVSLVAWLVRRENPPIDAINWIIDNLPALGVVSLILITFGIYQAWQARSK